MGAQGQDQNKVALEHVSTYHALVHQVDDLVSYTGSGPSKTTLCSLSLIILLFDTRAKPTPARP